MLDLVSVLWISRLVERINGSLISYCVTMEIKNRFL